MKINMSYPAAFLAAFMLASPVLAQEADGAAERAVEADAAQVQQQQSLRGGVRDPLDPLSLPARQGRQATASSANAFNPMVSVILDGVFYADDEHGEAQEIIEEAPGFGGGAGHGHGGHGGIQEGFNLRETEITFSATVDPYFDAVAVVAIEGSDAVELEEAYGVTRALPGGLQVKFGRFLSDVGYINKQHPHDWAFVDRPLVNELLFGDHGIQENGVQLSWVAPTRSYTRVGVELLQGETSGIAGYEGPGRTQTVTIVPAEDGVNNDAGQVCEGVADGAPCRVRSRVDHEFDDVTGPRLYTGFLKWAPNMGFDHAMQLGLSGGVSRAWQQIDEHSSTRLETWDGDAWFAGVDMVYKYDAGRGYGHGNLVLQGEYFYRERDVRYFNRIPDEFGEDTVDVIDDVDQTHRQDGMYLQAVYGIAPRWKTGLRYDGVGFRNRAYDGADRVDAGTSHRYTANLTFLPTEFSRLRLQFAHGDIDSVDDDHGHDFNQVMLQYQLSLGAHGAHSF